MFVIDYGSRTPRECLTDGILAMAAEILAPQHAATGDAAMWAENAAANVSAADDYGDECDEFLTYLWSDGAEYLYQATGLHAVEDGYAGGLFFLTDAEIAAGDD